MLLLCSSSSTSIRISLQSPEEDRKKYESNLCTLDLPLRTVIWWCTSDLLASSPGCDISSPSSLTIDIYLKKDLCSENIILLPTSLILAGYFLHVTLHHTKIFVESAQSLIDVNFFSIKTYAVIKRVYT